MGYELVRLYVLVYGVLDKVWIGKFVVRFSWVGKPEWWMHRECKFGRWEDTVVVMCFLSTNKANI